MHTGAHDPFFRCHATSADLIPPPLPLAAIIAASCKSASAEDTRTVLMVLAHMALTQPQYKSLSAKAVKVSRAQSAGARSTLPALQAPVLPHWQRLHSSPASTLQLQ